MIAMYNDQEAYMKVTASLRFKEDGGKYELFI